MSVEIPNKSAFATQIDVIWALYIRETLTRFGLYKLGLIWAIIEPLTSTLIIGLLLGTLLQRTVPYIPYPLFILTGFVPFNMFTNTLSGSTAALTANQGLLVYRQVKPLDPFIARLVIEIVFSTLSFVLFMVAAVWAGITPPDFPRPMALIISIVSLIMFTAGTSIIVGVHSRYHTEIKKVLPLLMRPLLFLSGVIFPIRILPSKAQHILLLNPIASILETIRASMFSGYSQLDLSLLYPFSWAIIALSCGLSYYWRERKLLCEEPRQ